MGLAGLRLELAEKCRSPSTSAWSSVELVADAERERERHRRRQDTTP